MSSSSDSPTDNETSRIFVKKPAKLQKGKFRKVSFNTAWLKTYEWLQKDRENEDYVRCVVCSSKFSFAKGGEYNIKKHMTGVTHMKLISDAAKTKNISNFFCTSKEKLSSSISEAVFVYHTVQHSHSYLSASCSSSLFKVLCPDSKIAEKFACARTKCTKIATNVIAPAIKRKLLDDLAFKPFAIATDASNHGNVKTFPLIVRYFDAEVGVCTKLLAFYDLPGETSKEIAESLKRILSSNGLSLDNVTAYSADNASVNFGKNQSVFTELKSVSADILPMGCVCHILHNCAKKGRTALLFDLEAIVCMCYNEFSSSTKNITALKGRFTLKEIVIVDV